MWMILGAGTAAAQDSLSEKLVREQTSPVTVLRDELYTSPALKAWQRENTYSRLSASFGKHEQDLYLQQEGSGKQQLDVHSETYLRGKDNTTIWGKAYYISEKLFKVKFNESANYDLVYPYVMADTVGGDLNSETYAFSGGLAKGFGKYQVGVQAGFKGEQSYRNRDPRPKNISTILDLGVAVSRRLGNRYLLALDLNGTKYNQENKLEFVSEVGEPLIYHDAGLGAYNEFLSGARMSANYNGFIYGAGLQLSPAGRKGWYAGVSVQQTNIGKLLDRIVFEIGTAKERLLSGRAGYIFDKDDRHFMAGVKATGLSREGLEAKFQTGASDISIVKIAEDVRYKRACNTVGANVLYGRTGGFADWYAGADAEYLDELQQYVQPNRRLSFTRLTAGIHLTGRKQFGRTSVTLKAAAHRQETLEQSGSWSDINPQKAIFSMMNSNFAFLTASGMNYRGQARVDFPLMEKLACFIAADAAHQTGTGRQEWKLTTAFQF
nr:DUF6850 family outer membrane beta-barrel protein [Chitinophaga chungangae]